MARVGRDAKGLLVPKGLTSTCVCVYIYINVPITCYCFSVRPRNVFVTFDAVSRDVRSFVRSQTNKTRRRKTDVSSKTNGTIGKKQLLIFPFGPEKRLFPCIRKEKKNTKVRSATTRGHKIIERAKPVGRVISASTSRLIAAFVLRARVIDETRTVLIYGVRRDVSIV